jgi:hypothetical protein
LFEQYLSGKPQKITGQFQQQKNLLKEYGVELLGDWRTEFGVMWLALCPKSHSETVLMRKIGATT